MVNKVVLVIVLIIHDLEAIVSVLNPYFQLLHIT